MKKIIFLSFALLFSMSVIAQDKFSEGKIIMTQTMDTDNEQMKGMLAQYLGDEPMLMTMYVKGDKSRAEMKNSATGDIITISDIGESKMLMLMDNPMMGKKYALTSFNKEKEDELKDNVTVVKGSDTKTILGYECKRLDVTVDQDGTKMDMVMYVTDKIVSVMSQQTAMLGDKVDGFPMYMEIGVNQQGVSMTIIFEVTEMNKESVSDTKFNMTPPEGYSEIKGM